MELKLYEVGQTIVSAAGTASIRIGPSAHGIVWYPERIDVRISTTVFESQCVLYMGNAAIDAYYLDQTFSGSRGDATERCRGMELRVGSSIWAVWTGADVGAQAFLTITGRLETL